jgi:hypothetical protein
VSDKPWITAAETAELVLALDVCGMGAEAETMFEEMQFLRQDDGAYQEGWVFPENVFWPGRTAPWTSGAVLLADDALAQRSPAWNLFRGDELPTGLSSDEITEHLPVDDLRSVDSPRTA